jgi:formylglycine-generating enzyme
VPAVPATRAPRRLGIVREVPGGDSLTGSDEHHPEERPAPVVAVPAFAPADWQLWWRWVPGADRRHPAGPGARCTVASGTRRPRRLGGRRRVRRLGRPEAAHRGPVGARRAGWGGPDGQRVGRGGPARRPGDGRQLGEALPLGEHLARRPEPHHAGREHPPHGHGLVDTTGNVWGWTSSPWTEDHGAGPAPGEAGQARCGGRPVGPVERSHGD